MTPREFTQRLHERIPLSAAMGIEVSEFSPQRVLLSAPLKANINHVGSVFGGSIYSAGALACYTMFQAVAGAERPLTDDLVIQHGQIQYLKPVRGDFQVEASRPDEDLIRRFFDQLDRIGKGRLEVRARVLYQGEVCAQFAGRYVFSLA
ncbi:MAG: YiiD C-terminal domain-containing protein [Bdellovibrionaceae bacterium]|nr:YiiD C-terminal domain-containing protein [Pseudobdellovibrionaceae bacterium]MBX3033377.1 YiiD C-terminal domain-containing protein [Pseudobdellovibrionaceae bacterium]